MALPFSSMVIKLGLNGSLAPAARTSVAWPFPSAKALRELRFFLNRIEMRFRRLCFSTGERRSPGRVEMLSLVGDGG